MQPKFITGFNQRELNSLKMYFVPKKKSHLLPHDSRLKHLMYNFNQLVCILSPFKCARLEIKGAIIAA